MNNSEKSKIIELITNDKNTSPDEKIMLVEKFLDLVDQKPIIREVLKPCDREHYPIQPYEPPQYPQRFPQITFKRGDTIIPDRTMCCM